MIGDHKYNFHRDLPSEFLQCYVNNKHAQTINDFVIATVTTFPLTTSCVSRLVERDSYGTEHDNRKGHSIAPMGRDETSNIIKLGEDAVCQKL